MSHQIIEHGSRHTIRCPQCSGDAIYHHSPATYLETLAMFATFGLAIQGYWSCLKCGCKFRPTDVCEGREIQ